MRTRRERLRAATLQEIKETARALMCRSGSTELQLSAVAREMQMSAPALYRYFDGRDALLTELISDAYTAQGDALLAARDTVPAADPGGRLLAVATAYRRWARDFPQDFTLLYGGPVPGYAAPEDGPTTTTARRSMAVLLDVVVEAERAGQVGEPLLPDVPEPLLADLSDMQALAPDVSAARLKGALHGWAVLHGFLSLEVFGHLQWVGDSHDALWVEQVRVVARLVGLPEPAGGWPTG